VSEGSAPQERESGPETLVLAAAFPHLDPTALFEHWTVPALISRWWAPEAEVEPWVGGRYHLAWPTMEWMLRGEITHHEPVQTFGFTWAWDHEPETSVTRVVVTMQGNGSGSRITLTHGPYPDSEQGRDMRQGHLEGWRYFLPKLAELTR
jgi:uncharacterized protein YndB with AHSA1/START domain